MTLGRAPRQGDLLDAVTPFCEATLAPESIYTLLHRERDRLFPDDLFADLFTDRGRRSVPPAVVATVMVLQRLEGLSDREAVERYTFDVRWRYAAGVGSYAGEGPQRFVHTVLVDLRERLRRSERPDRVFAVSLQVARAAGLVGRRRVVDSTPLYDAVATMDTITLIRSALRGLLAAAGPALAAELRATLTAGDEYASLAKPQIDWDDPAAREALLDSRATDAYACLALLHGRPVSPELAQAAALLATVVGQDLEPGDDGVFRLARRVAPDRIISTVDPEARHGHKTSARGFDGYKGHVAVDPDSEIITATAVSAANASDASVAPALLAECLPSAAASTDAAQPPQDAAPVAVYGDAAYGTGPLLAHLETAGAVARLKVSPPVAPAGHFPKDRFAIDLDTQTVTCPAGRVVPLRPTRRGLRVATFGAACAACALGAHCTTSPRGRCITVAPHEARLATARARQRDPAWKADYRATRPIGERKLGHLMRRRHGGRRARMRGRERIAQDFVWLAAAVNLARLATLGLTHCAGAWATVRA
jgi:hypothetical protein